MIDFNEIDLKKALCLCEKNTGEACKKCRYSEHNNCFSFLKKDVVSLFKKQRDEMDELRAENHRLRAAIAKK